MNTDPGDFRRNDIPGVLYQLAQVLPEFELADLEDQLQSFDEILAGLSPSAWASVAQLLRGAASRMKSPETADRVAKAADAISAGRRATIPYDHEAAMRRYRYGANESAATSDAPPTSATNQGRYGIGSAELPAAAYELGRVLPEFSLADLEDQLRTFDDFLAVLPKESRTEAVGILRSAAARTESAACRQRIEKAALDIAEGRRATEPYDHRAASEALRRAHRIEFRRPWETDAILDGEPFDVVWKGARRSVDEAAYRSFVDHALLYSDPNFDADRGGPEVERWLDAQGRIVAAKHSWFSKDDDSTGFAYYISDE